MKKLALAFIIGLGFTFSSCEKVDEATTTAECEANKTGIEAKKLTLDSEITIYNTQLKATYWVSTESNEAACTAVKSDVDGIVGKVEAFVEAIGDPSDCIAEGSTINKYKAEYDSIKGTLSPCDCPTVANLNGQFTQYAGVGDVNKYSLAKSAIDLLTNCSDTGYEQAYNTYKDLAEGLAKNYENSNKCITRYGSLFVVPGLTPEATVKADLVEFAKKDAPSTCK